MFSVEENLLFLFSSNKMCKVKYQKGFYSSDGTNVKAGGTIRGVCRKITIRVHGEEGGKKKTGFLAKTRDLTGM